MTDLCYLAERHGCDKCPAIGHDYTPIYAQLVRGDIASLLEIGVGSKWAMRHLPSYQVGASLRMWADWCKAAQIYGVDINPEAESVTGDRLHIQIADATKDELFPEVEAWDVIIDDGSHKPIDQKAAFARLWPRLKAGGVYVIEDVRHPEVITEFIASMGLSYRLHEFPNHRMTGDNRLLVIPHQIP